jgi:tetratricopeptide (TPR) repeat protein/TolB-like protein
MTVWSTEIKELDILSESFKGQLPDLEKELERLVKAEDENMILLYSRRCLEVIITDLCECELRRSRKTEPLQGIIDKLNKEEKVPSHIIASMHSLNSLSTFGTHPKDFDPEQVRPVLVNLEIIIKWYLKYKQIVSIGRTEIEEEKSRLKENPMEEVKKETRIEEQENPVRLTRRKFLSGVLISAILVIAVILAYPKIFKQETLEKLRSSGEKITVAVMPFKNMTNDTTLNIWQEAIQYNLTTFLSNYSDELKVSPTESIAGLLHKRGFDNYSSYAAITSSDARSISHKLDADFYINGNINQSGSTIRLNAQLVDSKKDEIIKPFRRDGKVEDIIPLMDSLNIMMKNILVISKLGKELSPDFMWYASASSPEAFRYFKSGQNAFNERDFPRAEKLYSQALAIDSNFAGAYTQLIQSYLNQGKYDQAKKLSLERYIRSDKMPPQLKIMTYWMYANCFETAHDEINYAKQLLEIDDQAPSSHFVLGMSYFNLDQFENGIPEYEKALNIYKKLGIIPSWTGVFSHLGSAYLKTGQYEKAKKLYKTMEKDFPGNPDLLEGRAILALREGDTTNADLFIAKLITARKDLLWSEAGITTSMAGIYSEAGKLQKAEETYRQALSSEPENPERMNSLAWFLIDKDRNIDEGLELIDKALALSPGDFEYLDTKGWGLYKKGNFQEALDILTKSWNLRKEHAVYYHKAYLHLEAAKKAVAGQ